MQNMEERQKQTPRRKPEGSRPPQDGERKRPPRPRPEGSRPPQNGEHRRPPRPRPEGSRPPQNGEHRRPPRPRPEGSRPPQNGERRRPPRPRPEGSRPPQNGEHRRPPRPRPEGSRPPQNGERRRPPRPRPESSRSANTRAAANGQRRPAQRQPAAAHKADTGVSLLSMLMFLVFVVIYVIILSWISKGLLKKANTFLSEYEASRPQYKIEEYVAQLSDAFLENMLKQSAADIPVSAYETTDMLLEDMMPEKQDEAVYHYRKTEDFVASHPTYYILRDEEAVATVALDRSGWTDDYSFPVWRVNEPVSLLEVQAEPAYTVSVTIPKGAELRINGEKVSADIMTEIKSDIQLNQTELQYADQPMALTCEITGLYTAPKVEAVDGEGRALTPDHIPDASEAYQEYVFQIADEQTMDPEFEKRVKALTVAYQDYVINKYRDRYNNLSVLNNYLLPGSEVSTLMQTIINDIFWNNEYVSRDDRVLEVRHVKKYSDKLCVVDVYFETQLTKVVTNDYIMTTRWVLVNNGYNWYATSLKLLL